MTTLKLLLSSTALAILCACGNGAAPADATAAPSPPTPPTSSAPAVTTPSDSSAAASSAAGKSGKPAMTLGDSAPVSVPGAVVGPAAGITKVNLNEGTKEQFLAIPDVGARMAREFDEYRPYVSIRQFRREMGKYVSAEQIAAYEEFVYVPVDPDACDAETLQQLPGVTAEIAEALIAMRPFGSHSKFLDALAGHVSATQLALSKGLLLKP